MLLRLLSNSSVLYVAICISSTMVSCDALVAHGADPEILRQRSLHEAHIKYEARLKFLRSLNESKLAAELEDDSLNNKEPWNSLAFKEAMKRIEQNPGFAKALAPFANKSDRSALLGLLAIRRVAPSVYKSIGSPQSRTEVLVDALKHSTMFNLWGLPHLGMNDASQALIEENGTAAQALMSLLNDKSEAPAWGSSYARESKRYQYTIGDYAFAISQGIVRKGQGKEYKKINLPENPAERSRQMKIYKETFVIQPTPPEPMKPVQPGTQPDEISPGAPESLRIN
jgi:hypothetical protein